MKNRNFVFVAVLIGISMSPRDWPANATTASNGETVEILVESLAKGVSTEEFSTIVMATLNDRRGWPRAGFRFVQSGTSKLRVILAEPAKVDALCLPLKTGGMVSCQNGPTVALNADRWRSGISHWDATLEEYRTYLLNHEVGHLIGQFHPKPACPKTGGRAAVMEQQSKALDGCTGNAWPLQWEIDQAISRPALIAPGPEVRRAIENLGDDGSDPNSSMTGANVLVDTVVEITTVVVALVTDAGPLVTDVPSTMPDVTEPPTVVVDSGLAIKKEVGSKSLRNKGKFLLVAASGGFAGLLVGHRWHRASSKVQRSRRQGRSK